MRRFGFSILAAMLLSLFLQPSVAEAQTEKQKRLALLVGVTGYKLKGLDRLDGAKNDVQLMWQTLQDNLGFEAKDITVLADELPAGAKLVANGAPTRQRILAELNRLRAGAKPEDFVIVYIAGHGMQIPEVKSPGDEPDGMDEVFLPIDAALDNQRRPINFILDDEFGDIFYGSATTPGFSSALWVIFDSCHSGDSTRSHGPAKLRRATLEGMGVDKKLQTPRATTRPPSEPKKSSVLARKTAGGTVVVFSAAAATAPAVERPIPGDKRRGANHGVFTHLLAETIATHNPVNYASLRERLNAAYSAFDKGLPTPHAEGPLENGIGLPVAVWTARSAHDGIWLDAGRFRGLADGAIVAIRKKGEPIAGHARVVSATAMTSRVVPDHQPGAPRLPDRLADNGEWLATLVKQPQGPIQLGLKVAKPPKSDHDGEDWVKRGRAVVELVVKRNLPITWLEHDTTDKADIHLGFPKVGRDVLQFHASASTDYPGRNPPGVKLTGNVDSIADAVEAHLKAHLGQRNLLAIAKELPEADFANDIIVQVWVDTSNRRPETEPCPNGEPQFKKDVVKSFESLGGAPLSHCDIVFLEVTNTNPDKAVDITCVYLDADGGIAAGQMGGMRQRRNDGTSSCPDGGRLGRAGQGGSGKPFALAIVTKCHKDFTPCNGRNDDMPVGMERLMVIMVDAIPERRVVFDDINRPAAERVAPTTRSASAQTGNTPIDALRSLFETGARTRSGDTSRAVPQDAAVAIKRFEWLVEPPRR